ncbi:TetR/AcrR family transcriptional regulator [Sneathiella marina]|uniref:TetR/AcrR family transcriptional regulator n=1 Tax=Sneathiella marina TaxID=2950108 RepID=A0ABY4W8N6_9PROT|nr:TetR/AcrR family transcriptional regulator [Sneathiella marina]USG63211.1 TetR/AcrR family transcriptional regulator [Sneathiella marina]
MDQSTDGNAQGRIRLANMERIMKAAEKVFAESGFRGATTSAIALEADLPKANIHYYFGTKEKLYRAVLDDIVDVWLSSFKGLGESDDPAATLSDYVRAKMELSKSRPEASRVFANELIRGAPRINTYLSTELKDWVDEKAALIDTWIEQGKMAPVDSQHLIFHIWALTQTWADFESQWSAILGRENGLTDEDFNVATNNIITTILRTCGLVPVSARQQ